MGELLEAAKALSAPATKLIEVVSRGIGRAYDPRYKRKMADATAYEIETIAGAVQRNSYLPILLDRDGIQMDARSIQELAEHAESRMVFQEVRKQQNIEIIADKSYEVLKDEETVTNEPVDDDWIVRFFNCVEDISNEEMRNIWASVLAGEIKKPRSFSLRTLETLKNISQKEAVLFSKISTYSIGLKERRFLIRNMDVLSNYQVKYDDLRLLDECGLVVCDFNTSVENNFFGNAMLEMNTDSLLIRVWNQKSKAGTFTIKCIEFTTAGRELIDTLNIISDSECIIKLLKTIDFDHSIFHMSAHPITKNSSGSLSANMSIDLLEST